MALTNITLAGGVVAGTLVVIGLAYMLGLSAGSAKEVSKYQAKELLLKEQLATMTSKLTASVAEADKLREEETVVIKEKFRDVIKEVVKYVPSDECQLDDDFMRIYRNSIPETSSSK